MIKNDGRKTALQGARDKAAGLLAGLPDLFIVEPSGFYHGMFVELKVGKNRPNENQKRLIELLKERGYVVHVCYYLEEFMERVKEYFGGSHGRRVA